MRRVASRHRHARNRCCRWAWVTSRADPLLKSHRRAPPVKEPVASLRRLDDALCFSLEGQDTHKTRATGRSLRMQQRQALRFQSVPPDASLLVSENVNTAREVCISYGEWPTVGHRICSFHHRQRTVRRRAPGLVLSPRRGKVFGNNGAVACRLTF